MLVVRDTWLGEDLPLLLARKDCIDPFDTRPEREPSESSGATSRVIDDE